MMPCLVVPSRRASVVPAAVVAALLLPAAAFAGWFADDQGVYNVYQNDRLLGTERVTFEQRGDSSVVISLIDQVLPREGERVDTLRKNSALVVSGRDGSLGGYQSFENVNGEMVTRRLSMSDVVYTSYRQSSAGGFGDTYERPPGRIYVIDPQVFALFDVIGRDMHTQPFEERSITMLYITSRDSAVDGRVRRLGKAPFRVGKQTVMAERFRITDPWSEFYLWVSPKGRMLRLTLPAVGLRVDRDPNSLEPGRIKPIKPIDPPPTGVPAVIMAPTPKPGPKARADSLPPPGR
jgi:hypothetical protein